MAPLSAVAARHARTPEIRPANSERGLTEGSALFFCTQRAGRPPVQFLGLPLEVRHVTLSTGSLTLAASSLGAGALAHAPFLAAASGIAVIGILNFGVSFALALMVALRAREVDRSWRIRLVGALLVRLRRSPLEFVLPPR